MRDVIFKPEMQTNSFMAENLHGPQNGVLQHSPDPVVGLMEKRKMSLAPFFTSLAMSTVHLSWPM